MQNLNGQFYDSNLLIFLKKMYFKKKVFLMKMNKIIVIST